MEPSHSQPFERPRKRGRPLTYEEKWMVYHVFTTLVTEKNTAPISPCDPRILARQTEGIVSRGDWRGVFFCDQGCEHMVHHSFFFIGLWASPFPSPFKRL